MDKLRLRFEKTGRAVYISHLDLMRTMQRVFLRAGVPLKYSEGFNPHAEISIALPLSVGAESVCEILDFKVKENIAFEGLAETLTAAMPEGIRATAVYEAERKCKEIKWLRISGRLEYDDRDYAAMAQALNAFYAAESIVIRKKTKRGEGETDIRPAIHEIAFCADENHVTLQAVISAQDPTLNPELLVDALRQKAPELAPDFAAFRRLEILDTEGKLFI